MKLALVLFLCAMGCAVAGFFLKVTAYFVGALALGVLFVAAAVAHIRGKPGP